MDLVFAVGRFDDLIRDAPGVPLTREVRVLRDDANDLVAEMESAATPATSELIERLADMVDGARAVPLTDWIRIDRENAYRLCDEIRAALRDEQPPDEPSQSASP
jgi:hypothetical protein